MPSDGMHRVCLQAFVCPTLVLAVQVRSCSLDTWLPGQVAFMAATGNAVANSYWAGRRGATARLPSGSPHLATHLASKVSARICTLWKSSWRARTLSCFAVFVRCVLCCRKRMLRADRSLKCCVAHRCTPLSITHVLV